MHRFRDQGRAPRAALRRHLLAGLALLLAGLAGPGAEARPFVDAAGRTVEIPDKVSRVLAAGPPASVLIYTLAPARMIGWVRAPHPDEKPFLAPETRELPAYGRLTGRGNTANVEAVLAMKPDLIVDVGATGPTYASLADRVQAQTGIPYILLDGSFATTPDTYRRFGALIGEEARAEELAADAEGILAEVRAKVGALPEEKRPRVYYGRGPRGLETGLAGSINTEILDVAGARNVAAAAGQGGLTAVSPEQVLAWNPDVILTLDPAFREGLARDPLWSGLAAVRAGRIYQTPRLPFGWFDAPPGVNRLIGLRWLAAILYPDLFPQPLAEATRDFYRRYYHVALDPAQVDALLAGARPGEGKPPEGKPAEARP
ncbi:iron ABC transporter substrate-binding protein [Methylobacterium planeticum]|uniref:Iron ABC transporter substrate-binding protein n=2 Tax=Methylobacterium planeticum TaxID=2615211 RepID=A0A6N6MJP9_9HYPH|nr:iron ABC transporter substrate-binding protein [Methylobacterium planeticum]